MSLTRAQVDALLRPINPRRVLSDNKGMAHVSQQDVRAHLTRIFGFGGWSTEVVKLDLVREAPGKDRDGKDKGWAVTYRCVLRLTIRDPQGEQVAVYEDAATGTSPNLPTLGDAHDFAAKVAVSMALKRAATNLGDGFGLSLYNKGQVAPLVIDTLVKPDGEGVDDDVQDKVPTQVSMGHDDAGSTATDNSPSAALPEATSDQVSGKADSGPATTTATADASAASAPSTEDVVLSLRDRTIDATTRPKREGIQLLARLSAEAAKCKVMQAAVSRPDGSATTLTVLLDEAMRKLNGTSERVPA